MLRHTAAVDPYVPMPNTCHPRYQGLAEQIRTHLDRGHVVVPEIRQPPLASFSAEPQPASDMVTELRVLTVKKVAGGAPFVGDPMFYQARYVWFAAVDDLGRHVAGDAALEIVFAPAF